MKEKLKKLEHGGARCQLCINVPKYPYRDVGTRDRDDNER